MSSKALSGKRLVWVGGAVMALLGLCIFLGFAVVGRKLLVRASLLSEGRRRLGDFGEGLAHCAVKEGLPPSSPLVPADPGTLAGKGYASTASDWSAEAFRCAHFGPVEATSHYQIGWTRENESTGYVQALGDINQDGKLDTDMRAPIMCKVQSPARPGVHATFEECGIGPVHEEALP